MLALSELYPVGDSDSLAEEEGQDHTPDRILNKSYMETSYFVLTAVNLLGEKVMPECQSTLAHSKWLIPKPGKQSDQERYMSFIGAHDNGTEEYYKGYLLLSSFGCLEH